MITTRDRVTRSEAFNDQGQPFFPDFKDPLPCTDLEVVDFDPSTATASRFRVMFKDGKWVIPSHYDYPADARDRLSKTAAAVMDLTKDTIRSDNPDDQEAMGVIDPLDTKVSALKGRGKRITLRDAIREGSRRVHHRRPDQGPTPTSDTSASPSQKRIYGVAIKAEPSTRFADWIETNLLETRRRQAPQGRVRQLQGQPRTGLPEGRNPRRRAQGLGRPVDDGGPRARPGGQPRQDEDAHRRPRRPQDRRRPAQARRPDPRPQEGATRRASPSSASTVASLQSKGFYMTRDGQLLSNQGDVRVYTDEGVVYTLRFGEVTFGSGDELEVGEPDDAEKKDGDAEKQDEPKKKDGATAENRYVMVTVSFDPTLIPEPKAEEPKPTPPEGQLPADVIAPDPNDPKTDRRREGSQGEGRPGEGRLREEDRRRQEAGPGADRPVRRLGTTSPPATASARSTSIARPSSAPGRRFPRQAAPAPADSRDSPAAANCRRSPRGPAASPGPPLTLPKIRIEPRPGGRRVRTSTAAGASWLPAHVRLDPTMVDWRRVRRPAPVRMGLARTPWSVVKS